MRERRWEMDKIEMEREKGGRESDRGKERERRGKKRRSRIRLSRKRASMFIEDKRVAFSCIGLVVVKKMLKTLIFITQYRSHVSPPPPPSLSYIVPM